MKIWRFISLVVCFMFLLVGCNYSQSTEYDEKELVKIEIITSNAFVDYFNSDSHVRTFDLIQLKVTDERRLTLGEVEYLKEIYYEKPSLQKEYSTYEEYEQMIDSTYNQGKEIKQFTQDEKNAFIKAIVKNGIYTWKDSYVTDEIYHDAVGFNIHLYFSDGSKKSTHFYFKYPRNYKKIEGAFQILSVGMFFGS
ncbi:hypothetical protein HDR67_00445 [bacterium]|nr:hypothetical protein [bacterium]